MRMIPSPVQTISLEGCQIFSFIYFTVYCNIKKTVPHNKTVWTYKLLRVIHQTNKCTCLKAWLIALNEMWVICTCQYFP